MNRRRKLLATVLALALAGCGGGGGGSGEADVSFPRSPAVDPFATSFEAGAPAYGYARIAGPEGGALEVATNQVLVTLDDDWTTTDLAGVTAWIDGRGGRVVGQIPALATLQIELPQNADVEDALAELPALPGVWLATPNLVLTLLRAPVPDPRTAGEGYWIDAISAPAAWDVTTGSDTVPIGLVDSGFNPDSGHFQPGRVSFVGPAGPGDYDQDGHGTAVATLLAADGADGACAVGLAWESPVLVSDVFIGVRGHVLAMDVLRGIRAVIDAGARFANVSLGPLLPDGVAGTNDAYLLLRRAFREAMTPAVRFAADRDALIVWSAGNQGAGEDLNHHPGEDDYVAGTTVKNDDFLLPATTPGRAAKEALWESNALIVAATAEDSLPPDWTAAGAVVALSAPGDALWLGGPSGACVLGSGTSFAAPLVTGTAALVATVDPALTAPQIREILLVTARRPPGWDTSEGGAGIVNAGDAVSAAD